MLELFSAHSVLLAVAGVAAIGGAVLPRLVLFVVRPAAAWVGLLGTGVSAPDRGAIAFFGIGGIGSLYYPAYALNAADFAQAELLWALVAFTVVISIVVHGAPATTIARLLDARRERIPPDPARPACCGTIAP